jgi:hypothetical protein
VTTIELSDQACAWSGIFPAGGRPQKPAELVGRDQDLAVIGEFVDELVAYGRVLLLSGEPGVGKSALLDAAEEIAATAGIRVLRAAGALSEDVSYFGLNQLLLPIRGDLNRLDRLQRSALSTALGFSDGPAGDRLVVSNAALALLRQAAAGHPLLLIIDNVQWIDQASALVLRFVARRLRGSLVGLIACGWGEPADGQRPGTRRGGNPAEGDGPAAWRRAWPDRRGTCPLRDRRPGPSARSGVHGFRRGGGAVAAS